MDVVGQESRRWALWRVVGLIRGVAFAYVITVAAPVQWSSSGLSLFFAGAIAICAMILPGISGSFILVLLGLYPVVLGAVKDLDVAVLAIFASGCLVGILSFARILSWMLDRWRDLTLAFLTGLMLGSLNKVWPWKEVLTWRIDSQGERTPVLEQNLLPGSFAEVTGQNPQLLLAVLMAVAGIVLVLGLEWFAGRRQPMAQSVWTATAMWGAGIEAHSSCAVDPPSVGSLRPGRRSRRDAAGWLRPPTSGRCAGRSPHQPCSCD